MTTLMHIADTYAGAVPYRCEDTAQDSWFALDALAQLIERTRPDIVIHAGGVFGSAHHRDTQRFREWVESVSWNAGPPFIFARDEVDAADIRDVCFDFECVSAGSPSLSVSGIQFCHVQDAGTTQQADPDMLVALGAGVLEGAYGNRPASLPISILNASATYVALGGVPRPQLMSPSAAYCGPVNPVAISDIHGAWASTVSLSGGQVSEVHRYKLPSRPRGVVRVDATDLGMHSERILERLMESLLRCNEQLGVAMPSALAGGPLIRCDLHVEDGWSRHTDPLREGFNEVTQTAREHGASYVDIHIHAGT